MERRKQVFWSSDGLVDTFLTVNMDLRSISHTFPSHRSTSLSHEDLAAVRLPVRKFSDSAVQSLIMDQFKKVSHFVLWRAKYTSSATTEGSSPQERSFGLIALPSAFQDGCCCLIKHQYVIRSRHYRRGYTMLGLRLWN